VLTVDELYFVDPADPPHIEGAQIMDHFHGRLRYVQRQLSCARCQRTIENALTCVGWGRDSLIDHAGLTLDDIRAMKEGTNADAG
jgi:hypothetical protein